INDAIVGDEVLKNFQMNTLERMSSYNSSAVRAYLQGGRKTGTKVISLGDDGMCVGVRYEVPLDQENFDPVEDARGQSSAAPPASGHDGGGTEHAPPRGSIWDVQVTSGTVVEEGLLDSMCRPSHPHRPSGRRTLHTHRGGRGLWLLAPRSDGVDSSTRGI